jgi:hypothetical protein
MTLCSAALIPLISEAWRVRVPCFNLFLHMKRDHVRSDSTDTTVSPVNALTRGTLHTPFGSLVEFIVLHDISSVKRNQTLVNNSLRDSFLFQTETIPT